MRKDVVVVVAVVVVVVIIVVAVSVIVLGQKPRRGYITYQERSLQSFCLSFFAPTPHPPHEPPNWL